MPWEKNWESSPQSGGGGGSGTVTNVSVVNANGLSGVVTNPTTTPAITLSTTVTGIVKGDGTTLSAAVAGDFPTLNQNTTGNAVTATNVQNGAAGQIIYQTGSGATSFSTAGTTGQILTSAGTGTPTWTNATTTPAVDAIAKWDENNNLSANNFLSAFSEIVSDNTIKQLVPSSAKVFLVSGISNQTIKLPDATMMPNGSSFTFINKIFLPGNLLIKDYGNNSIAALTYDQSVTVTLISDLIPAGQWTYSSSPSSQVIPVYLGGNIDNDFEVLGIIGSGVQNQLITGISHNPYTTSILLGYYGGNQLRIIGTSTPGQSYTYNVSLPVYPTTNYQVLPTDNNITSSAANLTITLPLISSITASNPLIIKDKFGGTIVSGNGTTIEGMSSITLNQNECLIIVFNYNTSAWDIVSYYQPNNSPAQIKSYAATTAGGYPSAGVLLIAGDQTKGILIGNNGIIYNENLTEPAPPTQQIQYLYCNITNIIYPSTGMLILAINAVTNDAGLLLGDNGTIYNINYDGTEFASVLPSIVSVNAIGSLPSGILLSKTQADVGNAAILFGNNNIIYHTTIS